jgi:hypothetical protein
LHLKKYTIIALFGLSLILSFATSSSLVINSQDDSEASPMVQNINEVYNRGFKISQTSQEGVIKPVQIKESAFHTTDAVKARTDTGTNTAQNITIDENDNWFVNYTDAEVSNLKRLYGVNGTFEDGVAPWTNYTINGGGNTQIPGYDSSGEYITCRNVGNYRKIGPNHIWDHSQGSEVGFEQVVYNPEEELTFDLRFDFRYATGPIDPEGDNGLPGVIGVFYQINDEGGSFYEGYYYPMEVYVDSRDAWLSIEDSFTIPSPWTEFSFAVGLYLAGDITLNNVTDYDDDPLGLPDGTENVENLTVYIDNVEFTGRTTPTFESVHLTFHAGVFSEAITGSGVGTASISNPSFWTINPLEVQITSNTSIIFTYSITSLFHRYINSSWTTDLSRAGVTYSVTSGLSSDLTFYTYITEPGGYYNATFDIVHPQDWQNTTVWDPLANNITGSCSISPGQIHIPTSELSRSGWWEINLNGLNYAKNISVQVYDPNASEWSKNSLFRPGNVTRVQAEIGTPSVTPTGGAPVNISWIKPDETQWAMDSLTTMVGGAVTSSSWTFGSTNTTAGEWSLEVLWTNGTEIAFELVTFDLYHTASIVATYPIIETDYGLEISNLITYKDADTDEYLLDDSVAIKANWSSTVVSFTQNYAKNWWEADFDTTSIGGGEFVVVVTASRPYFDSVSTEFRVLSYYETALQITNAPSLIERGLNEVFTAQIDYEFLNGTGIPGATPIITFTGPGGGPSWQSFVDNNNGHYAVDIVCDIAATYEVTITLSKSYHYNASDSFVLIIGETGTNLASLNGTADVVTYGDSYRLVLEYQNSTGQGLSGATLEIVSVTPETGLTSGSFNYVSDGYYEIMLKPNVIDTFSIVVQASLFNHETQYVSFTLTGVIIPTTMEILNADAVVENGLNEIFTVQMSYEFLNGTGITGASPTIIFTGPQEGLSWTDFIDNDNGLYSLDIKCNVSAIYGITITLSKAYHHNTSDSFTLIIGETGSELLLLNGTADVVLFGNNYILIVEYRNSTGYGLPGADLEVVTITPSVGMNHSDFSHIMDGYYQLNLTATAAGSFSVVFSASIINHETQYATFTLTATGIPTFLTSTPSSASIAMDQNFTVLLSFQVDPSSNPIDDANFTVTNPPAGLLISEVAPMGNGFYNFTLTPLEIGTFTVLFRSSAINYQSSSAAFTLIVTEVPTFIAFGGDVSSALAKFGELYQLTVYYYRADTSVNIDDASINATSQNPGLDVTVTPSVGFYMINIRGQAVGTWSLTITGNKTNHYLATKQFLFEVEEIDTSIELSSPMEILYVGRSNQFTFSYLFASNSSYIFGANMVASGEGTDWVTYTELGNGQYNVNLTPSETGQHYVILTFERVGFESVSYRLTFIVQSIPISVDILEGTFGLETITQTLRVSITETDTGNPVSGATVFYRIIRTSTGIGITDEIPMTESSVLGVYTASITLPDADDAYHMLVSCEADNYLLSEPLSTQLVVSRSFTSVLMVYTGRYWWAIFGVVAIVGALGYRRSARKRRIRQNKITLAIKRRFDDVKSLLGVIVLHKDSGLPVYSKILREGLEETVISAFITAITSFRGEFDIESSSEEWGLIPISDIVRVISTNKLVCAFITTGNPSAEQRERMIRFAKTVAFIFDDTIEEAAVVVLDRHTTVQFDALFEDILDGALLRTYKLDENKKIPTSSCADERIARKSGEEFKLEELAQEISACGLEEGRVYQAIMKALEGEFLVTTDESPFATELIRAPDIDIVEEEG